MAYSQPEPDSTRRATYGRYAFRLRGDWIAPRCADSGGRSLPRRDQLLALSRMLTTDLCKKLLKVCNYRRWHCKNDVSVLHERINAGNAMTSKSPRSSLSLIHISEPTRLGMISY